MAHPASSLRTFIKAYEDIEEYDKVFLLTWNPKPKFYNYSIFGSNNYNVQWWTMLDILMEAHRSCVRFAFVPEISDEGKLHMHGWFVVGDKKHYYKSFLPSLNKNGFIKKSKANSKGWDTFKYHVKDLETTHELLDLFDKRLVITHLNYKKFKKEFCLKKALLAHDYDKKQIKKLNVLDYLYKNGAFEEINKLI